MSHADTGSPERPLPISHSEGLPQPWREVRCSLSAADVAANTLTVYKTSPEYQRAARKYRETILVWLTVLLGGFIVPYTQLRTPLMSFSLRIFDAIFLTMALLALLSCVWALTKNSYFGQFRKTIAGKLRAGDFKPIAGERSYALKDDRVVFTSAAVRSEIGWSAIDSIAQLPAGICFHSRVVVGLLIPSTAFASEAERTAFFTTARDLWARSRGGFHGQCPKCGHDLTGSAKPNCPECGWAISVGEVLPLTQPVQ